MQWHRVMLHSFFKVESQEAMDKAEQYKDAVCRFINSPRRIKMVKDR